MDAPTVSVNMCAYNAERYVAEAADSILGQSLRDLELIIVDDGSRDNTSEILSGYDDPRVCVITQTNHGIPHARNQALRASRGRYIAVMDADDISLPMRLERQVAFLEAHPTVGLVGTATRFVDELDGHEWDYAPPAADESLRHGLVQGNPFVHTSVMVRKSVLDGVGGYDEAYPFLEDYELFVRLALRTRFANLPEVLVVHRQRMGSASTAMSTELLRLWLRLRVHYKAFRSGSHPWYEFRYVLRPVLFAAVELRRRLAAHVKQQCKPGRVR